VVAYNGGPELTQRHNATSTRGAVRSYLEEPWKVGTRGSVAEGGDLDGTGVLSNVLLSSTAMQNWILAHAGYLTGGRLSRLLWIWRK
jgi:hypothetical protein